LDEKKAAFWEKAAEVKILFKGTGLLLVFAIKMAFFSSETSEDSETTEVC